MVGWKGKTGGASVYLVRKVQSLAGPYAFEIGFQDGMANEIVQADCDHDGNQYRPGLFASHHKQAGDGQNSGNQPGTFLGDEDHKGIQHWALQMLVDPVEYRRFPTLDDRTPL